MVKANITKFTVNVKGSKMLSKLIRMAEAKAGSQQNLSKKFNIDYRRLGEFKAKKKFPKDLLVCQLADFVGLNPIETMIAIKKEQEPENAELWESWCARRESNPRPLASETNTLSN